MNSKLAIAVLIIVTVLVLLALRKVRLIEAGVFMLPFRSISFDYGLSFSVGQLMCIFALAQLLLVRPGKIKFDPSFLVFLLYCSIATIITSLFFIDFIEVKHGNFLRQEGRYIAQLVLKLFFVFGTIFTVFSYADSITSLRRILKSLLLGIITLSILGGVQFAVFVASGFDLFPIADLSSLDKVRTSVFKAFSGLSGWIRVCSYGGEPKGLAAISAVGTVMVLMAKSAKLKITPFSYILAAFLSVITFMTLSTGGIVLLAILLVVFGFATIFVNRFNWNPFKPLIVAPAVAATLLAIRYGTFITEFLELRIFKRISGDATAGGIEDFDQTIMAFLRDNNGWLVFGSGWGNIHNLTQDYIPSRFAGYMADTVFTAKSGYLQVLSENGVIGLLLMLFAEVFLLLRLYRSFAWNKYGKFFFVSCVLLFIAYLIRANYVVYEYVVIHGLALASLSIYGKLNLDNSHTLQKYT